MFTLVLVSLGESAAGAKTNPKLQFSYFDSRVPISNAEIKNLESSGCSDFIQWAVTTTAMFLYLYIASCCFKIKNTVF